MKRIRILLAAALLAQPTWAQTISLKGQVSDQSGAVVPGATVSISGPGGSKTAVSGTDGSYSFAELTSFEKDAPLLLTQFFLETAVTGFLPLNAQPSINAGDDMETQQIQDQRRESFANATTYRAHFSGQFTSRTQFAPLAGNLKPGG